MTGASARRTSARVVGDPPFTTNCRTANTDVSRAAMYSPAPPAITPVTTAITRNDGRSGWSAAPFDGAPPLDGLRARLRSSTQQGSSPRGASLLCRRSAHGTR